MKILVNAETKEFLGASFRKTGGDEAVDCVLGATHAEAPCTLRGRAMSIHRTVAEFIPTVLHDLVTVPGRDAG